MIRGSSSVLSNMSNKSLSRDAQKKAPPPKQAPTQATQKAPPPKQAPPKQAPPQATQKAPPQPLQQSLPRLQVPSPQELQAVQQSLKQQGREPLQVGTPSPLGQRGLQQQGLQQQGLQQQGLQQVGQYGLQQQQQANNMSTQGLGQQAQQAGLQKLGGLGGSLPSASPQQSQQAMQQFVQQQATQKAPPQLMPQGLPQTGTQRFGVSSLMGSNPPTQQMGMQPQTGMQGFGAKPATPSSGGFMKNGGVVKSYAKGGSVSASSRGDGIAQRGKTKGRMC